MTLQIIGTFGAMQLVDGETSTMLPVHFSRGGRMAWMFVVTSALFVTPVYLIPAVREVEILMWGRKGY